MREQFIGGATIAAIIAVAGCASAPATVRFRNLEIDAARAADWRATAIMGGPLRPAQAGYDVQHYDLRVALHPDDKRIVGSNSVTVAVVAPLDVFEIPLDSRLAVESVDVDGARPRAMAHAGGLVRVALAEPWRPGEEAKADVFDYIECFYNRRRSHTYLDYLSPVEYENRRAGT